MTISDTSPKSALFVGDGGTVLFPFVFTVDEAADIEVILTDSSKTETTLVQDVDYVVTVSGDGTGSITTTETYTSANQLMIRRATEEAQELSLSEGGVFSVESLEDALDKAMRISQENAEKLSRAALLSKTNSGSISIPNPISNTLLGWDASGTALKNYAVVGTATSITFDHIGNYADLATAISSIGASVTTLYIDVPTVIAEGTTVTTPLTLSLIVLKGGSIDGVAGGGTETLVINGPLDAGKYQIFGASLTVTGLKTACPEWFGENTVPGTTDMTLEIQSAVNAVNNSGVGGKVYISEYNHLVTGSISLYDNVSFLGYGRGSIITLDAAIDLPVISIAGRSGVFVDGLAIDGNGANQTGGANTNGIDLSGACTDVSLINNEITGCYGHGVYVAGTSSGTLIENNYIHDTGNQAANTSRGVWVTSATRTRIMGNLFYGVDGFSITVQSSSWGIVSNNIIENSVTYDGIMSYSSNNINISDNNVLTSGDTGIVIELSSLCNVSGNIISTSGVDGIVLSGATFNTITGNTIVNSSQAVDATHYDIRVTTSGVTTSNNNIVSNNTLLATAANKALYGIGELLASVDNVFTDNIISGQDTGPLSLVSSQIATVASHATTTDLWTTTRKLIYLTGTETITNFPAATQAGDSVKLICAAAVVFTHAGALTVQGNANYTAAAGDMITITAFPTTAAFIVTIQKQDGTAVV